LAIEVRINRDGSKSYRVRIATYNPETGARRNQTIDTFQLKRDDERAEREAIMQRDSGGVVGSTNLTLGELLDDWFDSHQKRLSSQSAVDYRTTIDLQIKPTLGRSRVSTLSSPQFRRAYRMWEDSGKSPHVIQKCHQRLKQALDQAVSDRVIASNPLATVKPPRTLKKSMQWLDAEEARRFLDASRSDGMWPLWPLLLFEGLRRGEALGLRRSDLHWSNAGATAHIQQQVSADKAAKGRAVILPYTKTSTSSRVVRLSNETIAALKQHQAEQDRGSDNEALRSDYDLICCTSLGSPHNPANVDRSMDRILKVAGLSHKKLRVHDLRHTCATLLLQNRQPIKAVSERLGHSSVRITLDLYAHLVPDMQESTAAAWDLIMPQSGEPKNGL
jgi:integrase